MGIAILKEGFATAGKITLDIIDEMLANGFKAVFPVDGTNQYIKPVGEAAENFVVLLEATGDVDPLNKDDVNPKQPWRVSFNVSDTATMGIFVGSATAMTSDGRLPYITASIVESGSTTTRIVGAKGIVGDDYTPPKTTTTAPAYFASTGLPSSFMPHWKNTTEGFINRKARVWVDVATNTTGGEQIPKAPTDPLKDLSSTYPMTYYLAITDRGFFLSIWEGSTANMSGTNFSWVLVQRPVQRDNGQVVTTGKAPVFCVNSVGNQINRFVVRESDVVDASAIQRADIDTKDCTAIINSKKQVGVSENNQYIVNYPSRLNTPRYAYTYELDMIGYASATVVSSTTEVPQRLYGESTDRTYIGMHSNQAQNNGMRILALKAGAGI
jgi:hypothetical protein|uniref:Uncharacterized protein n=1 Tax=Myoviridae sp. ctshb19 TaxID=2825194 RepID=A0A8S5UHA7_9CAUD|nr:MAG TPA: hypothetical protein [Myoviridae sp. ctshb19]